MTYGSGIMLTANTPTALRCVPLRHFTNCLTVSISMLKLASIAMLAFLSVR